jgi:nanoRNase/pAp phosphatase (c-di-AMP/oligoRNAs hydrolase)
MDRSSSTSSDERRSSNSRRRTAEGNNAASTNGQTEKKSRKLLDRGRDSHGERREEESNGSAEVQESSHGVEVVIEEKPNTINGNGKKGYKEFQKLFDGTKPRVAIFSHACPDPDAISSMMGMSWLLERAYGLESSMFYAGEISHPQNGSMVNLLVPPLQRVDEVYRSGEFDISILVDTVPSHAGTCKNKVEFDVVIDHHREIPHDFEGVLIHRKTGSCAGIVYDMMKSMVPKENWLSDEVDADMKIATALIAGIVTDTNFLMSDDCTEYERNAFNDLFQFRNSDFLHQIVFFKRRKFWVDKKAEACTLAKVDDEGCAVVGLGLIPEKERDLIADMAEEMVSWASVNTAVAFGVVGGDRIEGSVRSLNASLNVSDFCKKLGGRYGSGGGKHGKGAYQLPLAGFSIDPDEDPSDAQDAWEAIRKRETKRINRVIKK